MIVKSPDGKPAEGELVTLTAHQGYGTDEFFSQNITSDAEGVAKFTVDNIPANFTHLNFYVRTSKCIYLGGGVYLNLIPL